MSTSNTRRPVIVGIFILLGLAILVVAIFTLGGQKKTFVKSFTVHALFDDVGGLIKGGNVWLSGVKVGTVKDITFSGRSQVEVVMSIEDAAQSHIRKNSLAKIGSDGLIGNKIVVIYGGDPSTAVVESGDFLSSVPAMNMEEMMNTLQANNKNILQITTDFKSVSRKIDSGNGTIATLLNDRAMATRLSSAVSALQATAANFQTVSQNSKMVLADLQRFSGKINKPGTALNDFVTDTTMYNSVQRSLAQLQRSSDQMLQFATNLKTVSEKLNRKDNVTGVLLNDAEAAASVKVTLKNLETSSKKLDEDLEAVQHNFLLRGFFKKKKKAEEEAAKP
jgi:phospholipid/cholesterol/gamma-HCH transport system substrate-binding protein